MKAMTLGATHADWERVPSGVKQGMIKKIEERVKVVDDERAEEKKKADAIRRSERHKVRTASRNLPY